MAPMHWPLSARALSRPVQACNRSLACLLLKQACLLSLAMPSVLQAASFANLDLRPNTRDLQLSVLISHTHIVIQDTEPLLQKYRGYHRAQVFSCAALKRT